MTSETIATILTSIVCAGAPAFILGRMTSGALTLQAERDEARQIAEALRAGGRALADAHIDLLDAKAALEAKERRRLEHCRAAAAKGHITQSAAAKARRAA